jgi:flagellar basal-body rod protein FlgG
VFAGGNKVADLAVVEFSNPSQLRKLGGSLFENPRPENQVQAARTSVVRQGMVETSNVNPVEEMTQLIKANRLFEQDLKAMKTYGELLQREANDIGRL